MEKEADEASKAKEKEDEVQVEVEISPSVGLCARVDIDVIKIFLYHASHIAQISNANNIFAPCRNVLDL